MKNNVALRPIHYASLSGGKDSLFMLKVIAENRDKYPLDLIVHFELEIDYPWVKDVINEVEKIGEKLGVKVLKFKPTFSFYDVVENKGISNRKVRWCSNTYKKSAHDSLDKWIKSQSCYPVAYIGFCADETARFKYSVGQIEEGQQVIYPLAEEGYYEDDILRWAKEQPIFKDYYKFNKRQGCMYCPMSNYGNLAYTLWKYPKEYEWFIERCKETEKKYNTSIFQSNPKYNTEYVDNIVRTKYTAKLKEELAKWNMKY